MMTIRRSTIRNFVAAVVARTVTGLVFATALIASWPQLATASAHISQGINGGQLVRTDAGYVEFIGGSGMEFLIFAVSDLNKLPISVNGTFAAAIVKQDNQQFRIQLLPDGDNFLAARASPPLRPNASVVFIGEFASGLQFEASFKVY